MPQTELNVNRISTAMVVLMLFTSCWMYNVRRQRMQQMMMARHTAYHNQNLQNSYNQSPYDVNRGHGSYNQGQSQGWMGPPPAGPPPPGYSPSPHPGHQGSYQPPPGAPPKYGGDGGKGGDESYGYQYPPPPGSPPPAGSQQYQPPLGAPPAAHVHP
ncbi:hypothetical protein PQX77_000311 [Marasmius sp. AFHP31]|nr:hypothetical protein PQX77_000311 [Marasmius sp. AFHP31]